MTCGPRSRPTSTSSSANEFTTDVPEHSRTKPPKAPLREAILGPPRFAAWAHAAGPAHLLRRENLLNLKGDPYLGENILITGSPTRRILPSHRPRSAQKNRQLESGPRRALENTYAITDDNEYFAECTQSWFDCNAANPSTTTSNPRQIQYDPLARLRADLPRQRLAHQPPPEKDSPTSSASRPALRVPTIKSPNCVSRTVDWRFSTNLAKGDPESRDQASQDSSPLPDFSSHLGSGTNRRRI
jgi:hypothetical protein